jgi:hypothetical protein
VVGCKADVRRCFDSVTVQSALRAWRFFGGPETFARLIEKFYAGQRRWITYGATWQAEPIRATRGLLQGCPLSPCLLNGLMAVWTLYVKQAQPQRSLGFFVYLDDRCLWSTQGTAELQQATRAGQRVDAAIGLAAHPSKAAAFGTTPRARRTLTEEHSELGPVTNEFKLLGVTYYTGGRKRMLGTSALDAVVERRAWRIRRAVHSLEVRRRVLRSMVVSLFAWMGPFQLFTKEVRQKWATYVEHALWTRRPPRGRSAYLSWCAMGGANLHPDFAIHMAAVREQYRAQAEGGRTCASPAWLAMAADWG